MRLPISQTEFLCEYWQKKPLLLPQALPGFTSPLSANELAGFAMEAFVESRIIAKFRGAWTQQQGPFCAEDFHREDEWTLLVQGMDQWHEGVSALRSHLGFLPSWRFDDIMISYAVEGAGVGPHFDRYDVFLLQADGCREWRIGHHCGEDTPLIEANGLTLIPEFDPCDTYLLSPGDILYVPPGIAHWGIARGESLTFSLGFRAPSIADLLARRVDNLLEQLATTSLLEDIPDMLPARPGEITVEHIRNAKDALANACDALDDDRWFGEIVTRNHRTHTDDVSDSTLPLTGPFVRLSGSARVAWTSRKQHLNVFINGETFIVPSSAIQNLEALCRQEAVALASLSDSDDELLSALKEMGALEDCDR